MSNYDRRVEAHEMEEYRHEPPYYENLSRSELIAMVEEERRRNRGKWRDSRAMDEDMEEKDALIESLRSQLDEADRRNRDLEAIIRQLQYELDSQRRPGSSYSNSPRLNPILPRRGRTPGSSMSSGISSGYSGYSLTPVDTRTSIATTSSAASIEMDAVARLHALNSTVVRTASSLSKRIRYNDLLLSVPDRKNIDGVEQSYARARWLVGERVANALYTQPFPKNAAERDPPILLGQIVFEAVFASWAGFILGNRDQALEDESEARRAWRLELSSLESTSSNSEKWFASIMSCIHDIMMIAGWSFKKSSVNEPKIPLTPVITAIQSLRKSLEDVSSTMQNLGIYTIPPGSVFNPAPEMMIDAFASGKRSIFGIKKKPSPSDRVVATTGLGLQSQMERLAPQTPPLAAPRVCLERTFMDSFFSSSEVGEPQVRIRVGGGRSTAIAPVKVRALGN